MMQYNYIQHSMLRHKYMNKAIGKKLHMYMNKNMQIAMKHYKYNNMYKQMWLQYSLFQNNMIQKAD